MWWLLIGVACHDKASSGEDTAAAPTLPPVVVVPTLTVASPARAAVVGESVVVSGVVAPGSAPLTTLTINGVDVPISPDGGPFSATLPVDPGVTLLGARLEASDGGRAVDGRSVMAGETHPPGEILPDAVRLQLGPSLLDDDDSDPDDVAALAEQTLTDPTFTDAFAGFVLPDEDYTLTVQAVSIGGASVDITPGAGRLTVGVTLTDVVVGFYVEGVGWYDWLSASGTATVPVAAWELGLAVAASDGEIAASVTGASASLEGLSLESPDLYDWILSAAAPLVAGYLEDTLATEASTLAGGLIEDYLAAFVVDSSFAGVRIQASLGGLEVTRDGVLLHIDAGVSSDVVGVDLPAMVGSLATPGRGPSLPLGGLPENTPFAVAADDDIVNQLLFALWASGAMSELRMSGAELTALSGDIAPPLGPVASSLIHLDLPPVFYPPTEPDQHMDLALGELRMALAREDGQQTDASINVRTGAVLAVKEDGSLTFTLDRRPAKMRLEVGTEAVPTGLDPGDMAALMRLAVPPMLGSFSSFLPGVPALEVPLGGFSPRWEGQSVQLTAPDATVGQDGWLLLWGGVEVGG